MIIIKYSLQDVDIVYPQNQIVDQRKLDTELSIIQTFLHYHVTNDTVLFMKKIEINNLKDINND